MKPTYIVSILLFSFIATCSTFAQQSTEHISGRVTDTNGEPLPGATISIKGEKTGAVTTADGTYTLQLPGIGSYIITASYIGYQTEEKRITTEKEKKVNFRLSEDQFDLGTVVVTGTRTPKLLKDAPIIILDEATSSVDPENEQALLSAIQELTKDKTLISIAHRLSTVRNADQIIVIDQGRIVQRGTHHELLQKEGIYQRFLTLRTAATGWQL